MPYQGGGGYREGGRGGGGGRRGDDREIITDRNAEQFRKLFIGGLSYDTDEKSLKNHFEKYGEIADCVVMRDGQTKRSRGFGFITFSTPEGIDEAQKNRPHNIDGREIESKRAMPREETGSQQTILKMFVGGLKDDTQESDVRQLFEEFGEIDQIDMITDKATGKTRGFCFVTFKDYDTVDKCVLIKRHKLNGRNVEVKKAMSKQDMGGGGGGGGRGGSRGGRGDYGSGYGGSRGGGGRRYDDGGYSGGRDSGYGGRSSFGQNYDNSYSGGAMRGGGSYTSRGSGPYGSGYGSGGDSYGSSGYGKSSSDYGRSSGDYSRSSSSYGTSGGGYGSTYGSSGGGGGGYSSSGYGGGSGGDYASGGYSGGYGGSSSYSAGAGTGGGYSSGGGAATAAVVVVVTPVVAAMGVVESSRKEIVVEMEVSQ